MGRVDRDEALLQFLWIEDLIRAEIPDAEVRREAARAKPQGTQQFRTVGLAVSARPGRTLGVCLIRRLRGDRRGWC